MGVNEDAAANHCQGTDCHGKTNGWELTPMGMFF